MGKEPVELPKKISCMKLDDLPNILRGLKHAFSTVEFNYQK